MENIKCDGCGIMVSRKCAFSIYEYKFCSIKCLEPFQKEKQKQDELKNKQQTHGAFTFSTGGTAY